MIPLVIKLLVIHLLADFVFFPDRWSIQINSRKWATPYLYIHVLLHAALSWLILWDLQLWWAALWIGGSHLIIELIRVYLRPLFPLERVAFFMAQVLHLAALLFASVWITQTSLLSGGLPQPDWYLLAAIIFITQPTAVIMGLLLEGMAVKIPTDHKSLPRAGKYIGILERLFVLTFILLGRWDAIGLLITAKSVFRFNDLKESNNRKLTEYILIGTLMSFGFAILTGLAYLYLKRHF